jgi:CelD/BcsL family acetyltransferase involved in cellulose biosynthesis
MAKTVVRTLPIDTWRSFVEQSATGNIFHTPEMFEVFSRTKGYRPELWAVMDDDGYPEALMVPVQVTLMGGPARWFTTRAIVYGGLLTSQDSESAATVRELLAEYRRATRQVLFTEMRNLTDLDGLQPALQQRGFAYEEQLNYIIDLDRPAEEVLQSIGRRTRKRIRHAIKEGELAVEDVSCRERVALCYRLIQQSYTYAHVPVADLSLFESAFDVLHPLGMVKFLLVWAGDQCVAASAELPYKDSIFGWYAGVDRAYSADVPGELLMWHILEWGAEHGYRCYDFGGAGRSYEKYGVRDFKAKFGGELVSYGRNTCVHSPWALRLSKAGYGVLRRFL